MVRYRWDVFGSMFFIFGIAFLGVSIYMLKNFEWLMLIPSVFMIGFSFVFFDSWLKISSLKIDTFEDRLIVNHTGLSLKIPFIITKKTEFLYSEIINVGYWYGTRATWFFLIEFWADKEVKIGERTDSYELRVKERSRPGKIIRICSFEAGIYNSEFKDIIENIKSMNEHIEVLMPTEKDARTFKTGMLLALIITIGIFVLVWKLDL